MIPHAYAIYRRIDGKTVRWYADTEYGLAETLAKVADLISCLDPSRPVTKITIERIDPK